MEMKQGPHMETYARAFYLRKTMEIMGIYGKLTPQFQVFGTKHAI
jgi:hypothetical protein